MSAVAVEPRRLSAKRIAVSTPVVVLWALFAAANFQEWRTTHRPVGLGATVLELIVATLFIFRRPPLTVSRSPLAWIAATIGTFGTLAERPAYHPLGHLGLLYAGMQVAGVLFASFAMVSLGRSFGIVAANRGVRTGGAYRYVRHPVYAAYIVTETGYALENPSLRNWCLLGLVIVFQATRIVEEERTLAEDPAYREYCRRVRGRVVPRLL